MYRLDELEPVGAPRLRAAGWPIRKAEILERWLKALGELPPLAEPQYHVIDETLGEGHRRLEIEYSTSDGDSVPALLLLPLTQSPWPGILALHPTSEGGKSDIATAHGRDNRRYGLELVQRGYAVLAPDTITAGERIDEGEAPFSTARFVAANPQLSPVGKMLSDHRHAVSVLASLPEVDSRRIGAIGHSLGGYNAWFLAGLDERIAAVVSSCGFVTFAGDPDLRRWGTRDWFSHFPSLDPFLDSGQVPFEFDEILALAAPRPLFTWLAMGDQYFPHWHESASALDRVWELYKGLGAAEQMVTWVGHGGHDFPNRVRAAAYDFLDLHLGRSAEV